MDRNASADALLEALPYSKEAEQSVLGAVIADPARITDVLEYLKPESFCGSYNREIFSVLMRMFLASEKIDVVTLLDKVLSEGIFPTESDAKMYLVSLVEMVPSTSNVADYARIVQEKYYLRSLAETSRKILDTIREGTGDAKSIMDRAEQDIFDIRKGRETGGLTRIDEVIIETYDRLQKLSGDDKSEYVGTPSGFGALDTILTGLNKSDLILVAARPGMGKTSFALNIATNVAVRSGKKVAVFSLEMSKRAAGGTNPFVRGADPVGRSAYRQSHPRGLDQAGYDRSDALQGGDLHRRYPIHHGGGHQGQAPAYSGYRPGGH